MIDVPENDYVRRADRKPCDHCGASAAGCRSVTWLRGDPCCSKCTKNHDDPKEN